MAAVLSERGALLSPIHRGFIPTRPQPLGLPRRAGDFSALRSDASGHAALDAVLPNGGWARGALSELLARNPMATVPLLLPALQKLARRRRRIALIVPTHLPYARALVAAGIDRSQLVEIDGSGADTQWTAEQCLRDGGCSALVTLLPQVDYAHLRRLQLAADSSDALAFVLRPADVPNDTTSPAALRMSVHADEHGTHLQIVKCRGRIGTRFVPITLR